MGAVVKPKLGPPGHKHQRPWTSCTYKTPQHFINLLTESGNVRSQQLLTMLTEQQTDWGNGCRRALNGLECSKTQLFFLDMKYYLAT